MRLKLLAVAGLAACSAVPYDAGRGPITLSMGTARHFELYAAHESPEAFAVSEDGKVHGFTVCTEPIHCSDTTGRGALDYCSRASKGSPCRLLALGHRIVWQGSIEYPQDRRLGDLDRKRPVVVFWDFGTKPYGARSKFYGVAEYDPSGATAKLLFDHSKYAGLCGGDVMGHSFRLECNNLGKVSGSFTPTRGRLGGQGGADAANGRFVELQVLPLSEARRFVFKEISTAAR